MHSQARHHVCSNISPEPTVTAYTSEHTLDLPRDLSPGRPSDNVPVVHNFAFDPFTDFLVADIAGWPLSNMSGATILLRFGDTISVMIEKIRFGVALPFGFDC